MSRKVFQRSSDPIWRVSVSATVTAILVGWAITGIVILIVEHNG